MSRREHAIAVMSPVSTVSRRSQASNMSRVTGVSRTTNASQRTNGTTVTNASNKEGKDRKYYELAKKLYDEKKELKKSLKKVVHTHEKTLAKTTETYKEQLEALLKEKEILQKQIDSNKKLLSSYQSEKTMNKKLENTIVELQEKLTEEEQRNLRIDSELKEVREKQSSFQKERILKHNAEIDSLRKDYEKRFFDIEQQQKTELERIRVIYAEQNTELKSEAQRCRTEMESIRQEHLRFFSNIPADDQGIKRLYNEILEYKQSIVNLYARKEDELNRTLDKERVSLRSRYEKTIAELKDVNARQEDQISTLRETLRKVQENTQTTTNQVVTSLTTQKNILEQQVATREKNINHLQTQLKAVAEESVSQMNSYELKVRSLEEECKDISEKYNNLRAQYEKANNSSISSFGELKSYREMQDSLQRKIELLHEEKEKLETLVTQRQVEYERYRKDSVKLFELDNRYRDEMTEFNKIINSLKLENEDMRNRVSMANGNLENEKFKNTKLYTLLQNVQDKNNSLEMEISKKDLVLNNLKQELDALNVVHKNLYSENVVQKQRFQEELRQKLSALDDHRKSELKDVCRKNSDLENIVKMMKKELDKHKGLAAEAVKAREHIQVTLDFYTNPDNDYKSKISLINELEGQLLSTSAKFNAAVVELNKQISGKDKEIEELQRKLKTIDTKDAQLQVMTSQLSSIQNNYKASFEKLTNDHKKDRKDLAELKAREQSFIDQGETIKKLQEEIIRIQEECNAEIRRRQNTHKEEVIKLNRELTDVQVVLAQCDQKIEIGRMSVLTQMNEAKRINMELEDRIKEHERKNHDMSVLLKSAESKLEETQKDHAKMTQSVIIQQQKLDERFRELAHYEKQLRDAPPKLLDPTLRSARDEALNKMREMKGTIGELTERLAGYEALKKEILDKNEKIRDLEKIVYGKFNGTV